MSVNWLHRSTICSHPPADPKRAPPMRDWGLQPHPGDADPASLADGLIVIIAVAVCWAIYAGVLG